MTIINTLLDVFKSTNFTLTDAYSVCESANNESVRARIYENLNVLFERIDRGVYRARHQDEEALLIEGDGRDLSFIKDASIDCIVTDHPWEDPKSNKGGSRNFTNYDTFRYNQDDFNEKARVLKNGHFLIEFLPSENANNYEYLYQLKTMAKDAGFEYYAKVPWKKGTFIANTGRTSKNTEDVMIFTKGKARSLRPDAKKNKQSGTLEHFMSGAKGMLPTAFDHQPPTRRERIHQSEKPVSLIQEILSYITNPNDIVLDQFAGSGSIMMAAVKNGCKALAIEMDHQFCNLIKARFITAEIPLSVLKSNS